MRAKITEISPEDGYYPFRKQLIGREGEVRIFFEKRGWTGCTFVFDQPFQLNNLSHPYSDVIFFQMKYRPLDNLPAKHLGFWDLIWTAIRTHLHL